MSVKVILNYKDTFCLPKVFIYNLSEYLCIIQCCSLSCHLHMTPTKTRTEYDKKITGSISLICIILSPWLARFWGKGREYITQQLIWLLIKAYYWISEVIASFIQIQYVFHKTDKLSSHFRDAPLLMLPWFYLFFLRRKRIVSSLMSDTYLSSTNLSAIICIVQHERPSGGLEQGSSIQFDWRSWTWFIF